jgi:hypothetical protein
MGENLHGMAGRTCSTKSSVDCSDHLLVDRLILLNVHLEGAAVIKLVGVIKRAAKAAAGFASDFGEGQNIRHGCFLWLTPPVSPVSGNKATGIISQA